MKVTISGQVLGVHQGKSKKSGKEYLYLDLYDGQDLIKVFNPPDDVVTGEVAEFDCRLTAGSDGSVFVTCV